MPYNLVVTVQGAHECFYLYHKKTKYGTVIEYPKTTCIRKWLGQTLEIN